jgi:hypothetical protein
MRALFSATLFLSAALLFSVQPMIAKMLLPWLGGAPSVWNVCMVFFQGTLLGAYAYSHFLATRLDLRYQFAAHGALLIAAGLTLPVSLSDRLIQSLSPEASPFLWLLRALVLVVGLPFFVVASTGPLLQRWFSHSGHPTGNDPYFLYSASNLGSLLALLAYPVLLESRLRLRHQSALWEAGYITLALCLVACGVRAWQASRSHGETVSGTEPGGASQAIHWPVAGRSEPVSGRRRWCWLAWAFVPSSLMLGVTSYLATDIASIPLLWIIPLSLYLLSFVLVFARRRIFRMSWLQRLLPVVALGVAFQVLTRGTHPVWLVIPVHLLFLLLAAMVCHGSGG